MGSFVPFAGSAVISKAAAKQSFDFTDNIRHSVCQWCFGDVPLAYLCERVKDIGIHSIELLQVEQWDLVQSYGLDCAVGYANNLGLTKGFNDPDLKDLLIRDYKAAILKAHDKGIAQLICFSGNRNGLSDAEGLENCASALEPVVKLAERYDVIITMELLNSRIDHLDYQCDRTEWGVALVEKLGSTHFKLLYDIYHMQIMEGDIIRTITNYKDYISHFHTGGVPGRNEIDETQELNYAAIVNAISSAGYEGYIAQEFIPSWDNKFEALSKAIDICTI